MALDFAGLCASLSLFLSAAVAPASQATPPAELLRRIQTRHAALRDITVRFEQAYRSGMLGQEIVESGLLRLRLPGRMRWEYERPEKKLFLSDGKNCYFFVPKDRQVIVQNQQSVEHGIAFQLLAGRASLLAQFTATYGETRRADATLLRLTPRGSDAEVERVDLEIDASLRIVAISVWDAQGNESRFRFVGYRENSGLPDSLFQFTVPKGIEVIQG